MKNLILILLLIATNIAFGQEYKIITKGDIRIQYPQKWNVVELPNQHLVVASPAKKEWTVQTTFSVEIDSITTDVSEYIKKYIGSRDTNKIFTSFIVLQQKDTVFKEYKCIELLCMGIMAGIPIQWRAVIFEHNDKIYELTTTTLMGDFDKMKEITNKIYSSFRFVE